MKNLTLLCAACVGALWASADVGATPAVYESDAEVIGVGNYLSFCNTNEPLLKGKPRGLVVEFPGLGGGSCLGGFQDPMRAYTNSWSKFPETTAAVGLVHVYMMPGPWSWMNPGAVRETDLVVDALRKKYGLAEGSPLVAAGGSMGGLGALVYTAWSRHRVTACAAACPCYDVPACYACHPSFPRTYVSAIAALDLPLKEGLKRISPAHLVERMPDIPYFIVCDMKDEIFPEKGMDDYVARLKMRCRSVEYVKLPNQRHGGFTPEARRRLHDFVCNPTDAFGSEAKTRHPASRTVRANRANLAGVDHLGRVLPGAAETGPVKKHRQVGLFYYLWLGQHGTHGPWDLSKMEKIDPNVMDKPDSPLWPDMSRTPMIHWGEPLWGYYQSTDEWVLRRQVEMFIQAGIDVLYFDTTNGYHYREVTDKLFRILQEYHDRGYAAPKFCYYMAPARRGCGTSNVLDVWLNYYRDGKFSDLYFKWDGKPLIITHPDRSYRKPIWDFFTFRRPTWGAPDRPDTWYWSGMPEQNVAKSSKGVREMLPVTVATPHVSPLSPDKENAGWNLGSSEVHWRRDMQSRSCRNGKRDERPNASHYGFFFQEQIDWALAKEREDVPVAFICQWNEWVSPTLTKPTNDMFGKMPHWLIMMDECNQEGSRDIEPMKGGFMDAYYFQMMGFVRRWKGLPEPAKATRRYDFRPGDLAAWDAVSPSFDEMTGDCAPRDWPGYDGAGVYRNDTGRNEFKTLKVAVLKDAVAFYAETVKPLTPATGRNWMNLFVKVPGAKVDAMGYTHRIDAKTPGVACAHQGNRLAYVVPAAFLGVKTAAPFSLEFKWSDNRQADDVMDFYVNGDAAPRGRLNWLFVFTPDT